MNLSTSWLRETFLLICILGLAQIRASIMPNNLEQNVVEANTYSSPSPISLNGPLSVSNFVNDIKIDIRKIVENALRNQTNPQLHPEDLSFEDIDFLDSLAYNKSLSSKSLNVQNFDLNQLNTLINGPPNPSLSISRNFLRNSAQIPNINEMLDQLYKLLDENINNPEIYSRLEQIILTLIQLSNQDTSDHGETNDIDGPNHPCYRRCIVGTTMECRYNFTLESYHTLSKACFNCPLNLTDCHRKDCISADGVSKSLIVVNRKLPGPKIEVCQGDTVIIDLHNDLLDQDTTIHWHGQHQKATPYMDGVPFVTQCPIPVKSTFRYRYVAEQPGTHFWHSHVGMQRTDGDMGALIVREQTNVNIWRYDFDLSEHIIILNDWSHDTGTSTFTSSFQAGGSFAPTSLLINGKGRFRMFNRGRPFYTPVTRFEVRRGRRYRFRLINAEFLVCPIEMSIVGHSLTIISSDGHDVAPVEVQSLVSYAGERFDFVINANQIVNNYWIMFRGHLNCAGPQVSQVALLHYQTAPVEEPELAPNWQESTRPGLQLNPVNLGTGKSGSIAIPELNATRADDVSLKEKPDVQFFISYDFHHKANPIFHRPPYSPSQVPLDFRSFTPQFNHISMKMQNFPLMSERDKIDPAKHFCNESTVFGCQRRFCACTQVLNVPLNAVVELVMVDEGVNLDSNHPMHLHGYAFRVVAMERLGNSTSVGFVKELDRLGRIPRKLRRAPIKDTVTVPDGGYTIVRFHATNPGYWLFHCHIEFHAEVGMSLVFKVGEHSDFLPVPPRFPTCGDYID